MRELGKLRIPALICGVVSIVGCQRPVDERADGLIITSIDPARSIEAHYREGEHALVLRSRADGVAITSEIIDERGHDVTRLASTILDGPPLRTQRGELAIPVHGMFENARKLRSALQLSRHGLRQLRDAVSAEAADSAAFRQLSHQTARLHKALNQTRLALLQEWENDARHHIEMTPEEHKQFFAILDRQAAAIVATPGGKNRAPAAASSPGAEIAALLGPERYAQYKLRRQAWLAPAGNEDLGVAP
ncbi:MAG TPA: hypothetical protein VIX73_37555 [Kofleriaceae bacterium]